MRSIKYGGIFFIVLFISMYLLPIVTATPPRYVGFQYDESTDTLTVKVLHFSPIRSIHYIYRIIVEKNGVLDQVHFYKTQPSIFINTYKYNLSADPGDIITVSAFCVLFGYNTKTGTISQVTQSIQI
jgi:hypothetical protein